MKKLYACPNCLTEHSGIASAWEDGGGDDGDGLTPIFDCPECGRWFSEDEGFIGYEGEEVPPNDKHEDNPPPIQIDVDGW